MDRLLDTEFYYTSLIVHEFLLELGVFGLEFLYFEFEGLDLP